MSAKGGAVPAGSDQSGEGDYEKEFVVNRILVEQLLGELNEKERKLITLRYFEEKTQVQAAKELGVSQVQVSRLEKKILLRLRSVSKEKRRVIRYYLQIGTIMWGDNMSRITSYGKQSITDLLGKMNQAENAIDQADKTEDGKSTKKDKEQSICRLT